MSQEFVDLSLETIIIILVKQGIWIIRFKHEKWSFQSEKSLFYELNLRSPLFNQAQNVTKIEIPLYKDILLSGIKYVNNDLQV